jgi:hypothetical protein
MGFEFFSKQALTIPKDMHNIITRVKFAPAKKPYETAKETSRKVKRSVTECKAT